jgi:hypothetical protein
MIQQHFKRLLALSVLMYLAAFSLLAQNYKPLLGKWNMTSETDGDPVQWTLVLKETNGKLDGTLVAGDQEMPTKEFSYADGVLKFKVPYEGQYYDIELKSTAADKLTGTWSGEGASGRTTGAKA